MRSYSMTWAKIFSSQPPFPDNIPTCGLARVSYRKLLGGDSAESDKIFQGCKDTGFFLLDLAGPPHGERLLKKAESVLKLTEEFYVLDNAEKSKYRLQSPHRIFGWKGIGSALLENGSPDGAEFYNISQDSLLLPGSLPQPHPSPIHKAEDLLKSFALHARDVSALIFSHLNTHLDLPFGTLPQLHKINEPSMTTVRLIHAPPQPSCDRDRHIQARLLPGHTDNGSLTLLFNVIGGLQILPPDLSSSDDSNWRYVRPEPGCAIVNAGDALCQWSGGVLQSGIHRVVSPPGQQAICERYSFAYVVKPSNKASMKCLVGGEEEEDTDGQCTFEEWLLVKSKATLEGKSIVRIGGDSKGAN